MKSLAKSLIESLSELGDFEEKTIKVTVVEEKQGLPEEDEWGDSIYPDPDTDTWQEEITFDPEETTLIDAVVDYLRDKGATMQVRNDSFQTPDSDYDRDRLESGTETRRTYIFDDPLLSDRELKQIANRVNYNM